jgi:hypothetical protein
VLQRALCEESDVVRSMWRVTNRDDFVATGLPALGDFEEVALDPSQLSARFPLCVDKTETSQTL